MGLVGSVVSPKIGLGEGSESIGPIGRIRPIGPMGNLPSPLRRLPVHGFSSINW
jgi:hypothetical protein